MKKRLINHYKIILHVIDGLLVMAALWLAQALIPLFVPYVAILKETNLPESLNLFVYILCAVIWVLVLNHLDSYNFEKNLRVVDEIYNLMIGALLSSFVLSGFLYLTNYPLNHASFILFVCLAFLLMTIHRLIFRLAVQQKIRRLTYHRRILIAGAGEVGRRFEQAIKNFSEVGYTLVGFVDDNASLIDKNSDVLGNLDQVPELITHYHVNNLIIALPQGACERINTLMQAVHSLPVRVWVIPDYFALMLSRSSVWNFVGIPMITLSSPVLSKGQFFAKRVFDLILTLPMFLLTLPLSILISLLIKIDSPGKILYRSTRLKQQGETFKMLKFRTMVKDAEERISEVLKIDKNGKLIHKQPDDPRITRIGKILRKTSLDELPQLINIIKGEMSLVGPRPELPELVAQYQPWQYLRFAVPQGLTGWWQVNGRSEKPMHLHTDEDLYYIQHFSLWLDIQILIKTILIVLRGKGAY